VRQQQIRRRAARGGEPEAAGDALPVPYGDDRAAALADKALLVLAEIDAALPAS
jgi:hypothetical protein